MFVQFIANKKIKNKKNKIKSYFQKCQPLNIMLISYDSVSRSSWLNRLNKTNHFIFDKMKFELLNGYNIVGDGTPAALIPIYTGRTEEELPNVLRNNPEGKYVDEAYPFIWKELHKKKNYVSMYLDDWPHVSAFSYRMKGFLNHKPHYYYKHYQLALWQRIGNNYLKYKARNDDFCIGSKRRHTILLDLIKEFKSEYKNKMNNIVFMHYVENSHDTNERFNWVDNDLYSFLNNGYNEGLFDNTAIFLYSDHGARFSDKRSSNNGYLEERLPFFAVYLPDKYKHNNPKKYKNLKLNTNLLTSPFDIYATVRDLTCLDPVNKKYDHFERSISLLNKISPQRNCDHLGISEHFCTCVQDWSQQKLTDASIVNATKFSIKIINEMTNKVRHLCAELYLKQIITAESLIKQKNNLLKIQFITLPNKGVYEVLLINGLVPEHEFKSNEFSIRSKNDISRIDAYGEQPKCVANFSKNPAQLLDLRKFCYCKKRH